jgi:hypothetical protein
LSAAFGSVRIRYHSAALAWIVWLVGNVRRAGQRAVKAGILEACDEEVDVGVDKGRANRPRDQYLTVRLENAGVVRVRQIVFRNSHAASIWVLTKMREYESHGAERGVEDATTAVTSQCYVTHRVAYAALGRTA